MIGSAFQRVPLDLTLLEIDRLHACSVHAHWTDAGEDSAWFEDVILDNDGQELAVTSDPSMSRILRKLCQAVAAVRQP